VPSRYFPGQGGRVRRWNWLRRVHLGDAPRRNAGGPTRHRRVGRSQVGRATARYYKMNFDRSALFASAPTRSRTIASSTVMVVPC
jgi:hypothetical protein